MKFISLFLFTLSILFVSCRTENVGTTIGYNITSHICKKCVETAYDDDVTCTGAKPIICTSHEHEHCADYDYYECYDGYVVENYDVTKHCLVNVKDNYENKTVLQNYMEENYLIGDENVIYVNDGDETKCYFTNSAMRMNGIASNFIVIGVATLILLFL